MSWNINRKPLADKVHLLVELHRVDVLMLAESPQSAGEMLASLNRNGGAWEFAAPIISMGRARIQIYTRVGRWHIRELVALPHSTIRELQLPNLPSILLAAVHLPSKLWLDSGDQTEICRQLSVQLQQAEATIGHRRLLAVGDFNVNPFEAGMIAPTALNAESSRRVAGKGTRTINEVSYPYFYNPMWNHLGDEMDGPGGTYFYSGTKPVRVSWNTFDQVLVRPDLLRYFKTKELEILTGDGTRSFLNRNKIPDKARVSDHLPIAFKLN